MNRFDPKTLMPPLDEARLARQYDAVRARVRGGRGARLWVPWTLAVAATAALVAFWIVVRKPVSTEAWLVDGAVLESGAEGERAHLTLADGSKVDLSPHTRARLTSARRSSIRIDVDTGRVEVEATHLDGRTFVVGAGGYEVHVIGTHFVVERAAGERVSVSVDRGIVEITSGSGEARRLAAGEQWSAPDAVPPSGSVAPVDSAPPSAVPPPPSTAPPTDSAPIATAPPPLVVSSAPEETAKGLFEDAQHARAEGRPQDAARAFDRLRHTFRRDRRAPLAAFELGRLRLDALNDPRGAEEAFRDAMALGPRSPFREDAEARHVEALARMGDTGRCASARDAYLARWPAGTYRRTVGLYCGGR